MLHKRRRAEHSWSTLETTGHESRRISRAAGFHVPTRSNTVTSNPPPQFRHCWNNDLVARTSILVWVLIFKPGLMRTHRIDHQTRSRTCAWGLESCSPRQAWRQYVLTTHAVSPIFSQMEPPRDSKVRSAEPGTSPETVPREASPANRANGAYLHFLAHETLSVVCRALSR